MIVSSASQSASRKLSVARKVAPPTRIRARAVRISGPEFLRRAQEEMVPPLRVIQNLPNWIEDQLDSDQTSVEAVAPNLRAITRQAGRVERVIADMMDFEALRYHARSPEIFNPGPRLAALAARLFPDGPAVIEIYGQASAITCDPQLFDLIFGELIANAIIHNDNPMGTVTILLENSETQVRIAVLDDGPGIAADDRSRVFEPFEKLHRNDPIEGSGLGLSKVIRAAGLMNVQIEIGEAEEGRGTAVTVALPIGS